MKITSEDHQITIFLSLRFSVKSKNRIHPPMRGEAGETPWLTVETISRSLNPCRSIVLVITLMDLPGKVSFGLGQVQYGTRVGRLV